MATDEQNVQLHVMVTDVNGELAHNQDLTTDPRILTALRDVVNVLKEKGIIQSGDVVEINFEITINAG